VIEIMHNINNCKFTSLTSYKYNKAAFSQLLRSNKAHQILFDSAMLHRTFETHMKSLPQMHLE